MLPVSSSGRQVGCGGCHQVGRQTTFDVELIDHISSKVAGMEA